MTESIIEQLLLDDYELFNVYGSSTPERYRKIIMTSLVML